MSVIAKMDVSAVREFGNGTLIDLNCVYENNGLNSEAWEDRRFTRATPWGEGRLTTPHAMHFQKGKQFYLVFVKANSIEEVYRPRPECSLAMFTKVQKCEPWPGTTALEIVKDKSVDDHVTSSTSLNLRLSIDNPAAAEQFTDGACFYLCFYPADQVTLHEAAEGA